MRVTAAVIALALALTGCATTGGRLAGRAVEQGIVLAGAGPTGWAVWGATRVLDLARLAAERGRYAPLVVAVPDVPNPRGLPSEHSPDYHEEPATVLAQRAIRPDEP